MIRRERGVKIVATISLVLIILIISVVPAFATTGEDEKDGCGIFWIILAICLIIIIITIVADEDPLWIFAMMIILIFLYLI